MRQAIDALGLDARRARRARGGAGPGQRRPRPARRLLHGLAGDARLSRPSATASATSSASSIRRSATAGRSSAPTAGCASATPGRSAATTSSTPSASAATPSTSSTRTAAARALDPRARGAGRALRHAGRSGYAHAQRELPAAVDARSPPRSSTSTRSRRRLRARGRREDAQREHHQGPLPERRDRRPASSCGSSSSTSSSPARCRTASACCSRRTTVDEFADEVRHPAQRHPPDAGGAGADAPPHGRARHATGTRRGTSRARTFSYTNHTLLPEALETWPLPLVPAPAAAAPRDHLRDQPALPRRGARALPRRRGARRGACQLIDERGDEARAHGAPRDRGAASKVNGVAALHSRLLRETVLRDFAELWPERFTNITNGVTPRRFLALANPRLARLITEAIGDGWLHGSRPAARARAASPRTPAFREQLARRQAAPTRSGWRRGSTTRTASRVDPPSLFDAQCKRIHEYKRQHLNVLHVVWLYQRMLRGDARRHRAAHLPVRRQGGARATAWPS